MQECARPAAKADPDDWEYSGRLELVVWSIPALTIILLGGVAWIGSHQLEAPSLFDDLIGNGE